MEEAIPNLGCLHIYCGNGKGKTTSAIGLAIRAAGANKKILFIQFMKSQDTGELNILKNMSQIEVLRNEQSFPFFRKMSENQKQNLHQIHNEMILKAKNKISQVDMIILDELTYAYNFGVIDREIVDDIIQHHNHTELIITGRNPNDKWLQLADYVTEMKCIKHPYKNGIKARRGIEY